MNNYTRANPKIRFLNVVSLEHSVSPSSPVDAALEFYKKEQQERADGNRPDVMEIYEEINRSENFTATAQYRALFGKDFEEK